MKKGRMKKELFDGALVVGDGDALAEVLSGLPYLDVKRKDWKKGGHQWRVMVKWDMGCWRYRIGRYLGMDRMCFVNVPRSYDLDEITIGDGFSPLCTVERLPSFDAIREYVGILEAHVDLDFDYKAKTREEQKQVGVVIASLLALAPFLYQAIQILPVSETFPSLEVVVEALPLFMGWMAVGAGGA